MALPGLSQTCFQCRCAGHCSQSCPWGSLPKERSGSQDKGYEGGKENSKAEEMECGFRATCPRSVQGEWQGGACLMLETWVEEQQVDTGSNQTLALVDTGSNQTLVRKDIIKDAP